MVRLLSLVLFRIKPITLLEIKPYFWLIHYLKILEFVFSTIDLEYHDLGLTSLDSYLSLSLIIKLAFIDNLFLKNQL